MLKAYSVAGVRQVNPASPEVLSLLQCSSWIDLLDPSPEEVRVTEAVLDAELPTRKEAREIAISSRLYAERGTLFMTATVVVRAASDQPVTSPVTFVYQPKRLVTLRYAASSPFDVFAEKFLSAPNSYPDARKILCSLLDEIVNRLSDILEMVGSDLSSISHQVFATPDPVSKRKVRLNYDDVLARIGQNGERSSNARESLASIGRLVTYFAETYTLLDTEPLSDHWKTVAKDIHALTDYATFLAGKVNFFLDAAMGRINVEQTGIIKLFSVLAIVFLPPTLIASIEGMNFEYMPEMKWEWAYPISLVVMIFSAIGPYVFFKYKGWL